MSKKKQRKAARAAAGITKQTLKEQKLADKSSSSRFGAFFGLGMTMLIFMIALGFAYYMRSVLF